LKFTPALESALVSPVTLSILINDLGNYGSLPAGAASLTATGAVTITISPTHHAPILLQAPAAQSIYENAPAATNVGASLASLLTSSVATFDSDAGAVPGIAVTGVSLTPTLAGKWQYSTNSGATWTDISANVSPTNALLLPGADLLRFNPAAGTAGIADLSFHAWDQTSGQAGGTADLKAPLSASPAQPPPGTCSWSTNRPSSPWRLMPTRSKTTPSWPAAARRTAATPA
jgi:hypothetical protein